MEAAEIARLFQRAVVHENLVPCMTRGEAHKGTVMMMAEQLHAALSSNTCAIEDAFLKTAVSEVIQISKVLMMACGVGDMDMDTLNSVMDAKAGAKLLVSQALGQQTCYADPIKEIREAAAATAVMGPKVTQAAENLAREKNIALIPAIMEDYAVWRDHLPEGGPLSLCFSQSAPASRLIGGLCPCSQASCLIWCRHGLVVKS